LLEVPNALVEVETWRRKSGKRRKKRKKNGNVVSQ